MYIPQYHILSTGKVVESLFTPWLMHKLSYGRKRKRRGNNGIC